MKKLLIFIIFLNLASPILAEHEGAWSVAFDNDILVPGGRDQDYTFGVNATRYGENTRGYFLSPNILRRPIDNFLLINDFYSSGWKNHSVEYGLFGFTPEDISISEPNRDDRPFASLVYVSSTEEQLNERQDEAIITTLTLGILGTSFVGEAQESIHRILDNDLPQGWDNQISDGGEPTFKYSIAKQNLLFSGGSFELKRNLQASLGYITEVSSGLSFRTGKFHNSWLSFNPDLTSYGEKSNAVRRSIALSEHYFWAGAAVKIRAHNTFLQGQFRDSSVTYDFDELNHAILESWAGYTMNFTNGFNISYYIRGHTTEVKSGGGRRNLVWGGILFGRNFG